jgi:heme oxygenase
MRQESQVGSDDMNFTQLMRKTSRDVHSLSDALVNAKLGATASSSRVWREGLAVFYRIFRFLEQECLEKTSAVDVRLEYLKVEGMERTKRFEQDLKHYYGRNWRTMIEPMSPELAKYIEHLEKLKQEEPVALSAFIYHMYMGLFAGGQILRKKRALVNQVCCGYLPAYRRYQAMRIN